MTALDRSPPTSNYLQPTKFQLFFPRISSTVYFCQETSIPAVSSAPVKQPSPFVDIFRPGDKLVYGEFNMRFIVDEELWSWEIIHDWMRGYSFPFSFDEYKNLDRSTYSFVKNTEPQYSDGHLTVLSALNNPKFTIKFQNMFPTSLSEINFDVMGSADKPMTATATFKYSLYNIERI